MTGRMRPISPCSIRAFSRARLAGPCPGTVRECYPRPPATFGNLPFAMPSDRRFSTAAHESGHALVGLSCGLVIHRMHIDDDDVSGGTQFGREDVGRLMLDDQVAVALAGGEAVEIMGCEHVPQQDKEDHALVRATLLRHGIDEHTDAGNARGMAIRKNARAWARVILAPRREKIMELATALSKAGTLDEEQIAALLAS